MAFFESDPHYLVWAGLQFATAVVFGAIAFTVPMPAWLSFVVFAGPVMAVRLYFEDDRRTEPIVRKLGRR